MDHPPPSPPYGVPYGDLKGGGGGGDPQWLAGFTSGEGSFFIRIIASTTSSLGFIVKLVFKLGQHSREEILIKSFIDYFDCGHVTLWGGQKNEVVFNVTKLSDIVNKIIPFYRKYGIIGGKLKDFSDWSTVAEMMLKKEHLTAPRGGPD